MVAFIATDPRCVGPLPFFLRSIFVAGFDQLPDSWLAAAVAAFPEHLIVHGPLSASALAGALAARAIRDIAVTTALDADELLEVLPPRAEDTLPSARALHVYGTVSRRVRVLRERLARQNVRLTIVRPLRRRG